MININRKKKKFYDFICTCRHENNNGNDRS